MSKKCRKMLNVAINTDSLQFDDEAKTDNVVKPLRLKERDVKHIKVNGTSDLQVDYSFGEQIGQGSFGTVISVIDKSTAQNWAMKIVNKSAVGDKIYTLQREILILKMVDHPHIIYLDKVYESTKKIYLILERCYGELSNRFKEKKVFTELETKKIIGDLLSAIVYLHKNDIVHRDLKLENILLAKNPNDENDHLYVKVSDFGLSTVKQGSGYEDMLHDCCGTVMYMAPEIITSHSYSQQCDVWALGVIMFMLLGGRYPFYSNDQEELTTLICQNEPSYSEFKVSDEAIHLIRKMLQKNPALRITAAEAVSHPWIVGKPMMQTSENVLDMMRLWRSELMLPVGDECDWVSSARAVGSAYSPSRKPLPKNDSKVENSVVAITTTTTNTNATRRQSMVLPVKNIRFDRKANENISRSGGARNGRKANESIGGDDLNRSGVLPPQKPAQTSSKQFGHVDDSRSATLSHTGNKSTKTPNGKTSRKY